MEQLTVGEELGGYRLTEVLGVGGMGTVYLADDPAAGDHVALKVLSPDLVGNEAFRKRFLREAGYARVVEHPNIVRVRAAGEDRGLLFIAMDYVDGADLATLLRRDGRLEPERAVKLLMQLAAALDAVHGAGLIHRDVKPANCLVSGAPPEERALLTDFGVSRNPASDSVALTVAGDFVGTHFYTAPEQLFGDPDPRADVYSLGCMLYECLTGRPPFHYEDVAAVLEAHVDMPPPSLSSLRPDLPEGIAQAIAASLAKAPGDRPETCVALIATAAEALKSGIDLEPVAPLILSVTAGSAVGREIEVSDEILLGRGTESVGGLGNDIQLSRRHARIARAPAGFFVEDLGSTNGTLRNGRAIEGPEQLVDGDELDLGATRLAVRSRSPAPARLTLRLVLEPRHGRAGVGIDGSPDAALVHVDGGRWRLHSE